MKFLVLLACISMQSYVVSSKHFLPTCEVAATPKAFTNCLMDVFEKMKPDLIRGTSEYHLKPLHPFEVKEMHFHHKYPGMLDVTGYLKDLQVFGFDQLQLTGVNFYPKLKRGGGTIFLPYYTFKTKYVVEGTLFGRDVKDSGSVEINLQNVAIKEKLNYKLVNKNEKDYIQIEDRSIQFLVQSGNAKVVSSNPELQLIADMITNAFNKNPQGLLSQLHQTFGEVGNKFVIKYKNDLLSRIPADEIIPKQFL